MVLAFSVSATPRLAGRYPTTALAGTLVLLLIGTAAHAQPAIDGFDAGANNPVFAIAVQADGKVLVGGLFTMLGGGGTGTVARNYSWNFDRLVLCQPC